MFPMSCGTLGSLVLFPPLSSDWQIEMITKDLYSSASDFITFPSSCYIIKINYSLDEVQEPELYIYLSCFMIINQSFSPHSLLPSFIPQTLLKHLLYITPRCYALNSITETDKNTVLPWNLLSSMGNKYINCILEDWREICNKFKNVKGQITSCRQNEQVPESGHRFKG